MLAVQHFVNIIKNMKRLAIVVVVFFVSVLGSTTNATSPNSIVISEFQTESATSASEEFITVHNSSSTAVDVTGWKLQYFSATAATFTSPTRTIVLAGTLDASTDITVSSTGYSAKNSTIFFSATLSATGGHIRLVSGAAPNEVVHDVVGWGTAQHPEGVAAEVVARGSTYKRAIINGQPTDTDNNKADFSPPPQVITQPPVQDAQQPPVQQSTNIPTSTNYEGLIITELLPDPAAPLTDANDEFIELYNDSATTIDLTGLTLQTGNSNTYSYKLSGSIAPRAYLVLYASQTKLTLSNSSGRSQIIDAAGQIIDETAPYGQAPTGSSWQLFNNEWSWSSVPTPNSANSAPPEGVVTVPKVKAATTTKATTKAKTASVAATKQAAQKTQNKTTNNQSQAATQPSPVNTSVLIGVGILALGYILYEYRYDILQRYRQLKGNRTTR